LAAFGAFDSAPDDFIAFLNVHGVPGVSFYGMTETQGLFAFQRPSGTLQERARPGGSLVCPTARVRARSLETGKILPGGESGELEFEAPNLLLRYFEDKAATARAFTDDGWFRTGDVGYTTSDQDFVFLSRAGDVLRLSGFLVSPLEIAAQLESHPAVTACQVVGVKTPVGMKAVAFYIGNENDVTEVSLLEFCSGRLAHYKIPARFFRVEQFPSTPGPNGEKIQRGKLREMAETALQHRS
jgi:fatty-acyl-CoA synthase